jgi:hypothetical protein
MNTRAWLWAFLGGLPGWREAALVALVVVVLFGRSGLEVARRGGGLPWWLSPVRHTSSARRRTRTPGRLPEPAASSWRGDRLFWFLAIVTGVAVGAWIVTRTLIIAAPKLSQ